VLRLSLLFLGALVANGYFLFARLVADGAAGFACRLAAAAAFATTAILADFIALWRNNCFDKFHYLTSSIHCSKHTLHHNYTAHSAIFQAFKGKFIQFFSTKRRQTTLPARTQCQGQAKFVPSRIRRPRKQTK
jgi:hypothetical protein